MDLHFSGDLSASPEPIITLEVFDSNGVSNISEPITLNLVQFDFEFLSTEYSSTVSEEIEIPFDFNEISFGAANGYRGMLNSNLEGEVIIGGNTYDADDDFPISPGMGSIIYKSSESGDHIFNMTQYLLGIMELVIQHLQRIR